MSNFHKASTSIGNGSQEHNEVCTLYCATSSNVFLIRQNRATKKYLAY